MLALGLFACDSSGATLPPAAPDTLRIVSSLPSRGYAAEQARQIEGAISLALETQRPATSKLEYIRLDNSDPETGNWSPDKELANAEMAARDPNVIAYIGPYTSGAAMLSIPITNKAGLLQVSPSATWPGLTQAGYNPGEPDIYYQAGRRNFLSLMPSDSLQGQVAAWWARILGWRNVAVLEDGSTYSTGIVQAFIDPITGAPGKVYTVNPLDLSTLPAKLAGADGLFYAPSSVQNAVLVARALAPLALPVIATDVALDPQFLEGAGADAAGWRVISNSVPPSELYQSISDFELFRDMFTTEYGSTPGQFAANTYFFVGHLQSSLEQIQQNLPDSVPTRAEVLDYILSEDRLREDNLVGFTREGRPNHSQLSVYTWKDGRFEFSRLFGVGP